MMKVELGERTLEIKGNLRVRELLKKLELNPETVLVVREGELLTEDTQLYESDEIKIVNVISGG